MSEDTKSASDQPDSRPKEVIERQAMAERLKHIKHKVMVLSGKGGVGKSTFAANLAIALAGRGRKVGILDVDIHGPSIPKMLHLEDMVPKAGKDQVIEPLSLGPNLKVISIGFFLPSSDDAVIWRGPMKFAAIKQFIKDVNWGELDFLIVDSPPGTGDEPMTVCQLIENADGAVIVTTPQEIALSDVRRSVSFCRTVGMKILGVVENMSGFVCPKCGEITDIFKSGGGQAMAEDLGVAFLGKVPIDPALVLASDSGESYLEKHAGSDAAKAIEEIVSKTLEKVEGAFESETESGPSLEAKPEAATRIAIPLSKGELAMHFGRSESIVLFDVKTGSEEVLNRQAIASKTDQPETLPQLLAEMGVDVIIAGGVGSNSETRLAEKGIKLIPVNAASTPEKLIKSYVQGKLETGDSEQS